jgi:hypothetical protein
MNHQPKVGKLSLLDFLTIILAVVVPLFSIFPTVKSAQAQSASATLTISPSQQSVTPGNQVQVDVVMDPTDSSVSNFRFRLEFPSASLTSPVISEAPVFTNQVVLTKSASSGVVQLALGCGSPCVPYSGGPVTVATVTFNTPSSATGTTDLTFNSNSAYTYIYDDSQVPVDILSTTHPGTITFSTGLTPTPTRTPTPAPGTPTPTSILPPLGNCDPRIVNVDTLYPNGQPGAKDNNIDLFEATLYVNNFRCQFGVDCDSRIPASADGALRNNPTGDLNLGEVTLVVNNYQCNP